MSFERSNGSPSPRPENRVARARPRPRLARATTDVGPRVTTSDSEAEGEAVRVRNEEGWELRHGWDEEYNSEEYLNLLHSVSKWWPSCPAMCM